jgi:hypothetical protein
VAGHPADGKATANRSPIATNNGNAAQAWRGDGVRSAAARDVERTQAVRQVTN